jgi:hypothetical protein
MKAYNKRINVKEYIDSTTGVVGVQYFRKAKNVQKKFIK